MLLTNLIEAKKKDSSMKFFKNKRKVYCRLMTVKSRLNGSLN